MVGFNWEEMASNAGNTSVDFLKNVAGEVADFACGLYRSDPGGIMEGLSSTSPGFAFLDGAWRSMCGSRGGNPPLPEEPFIGGQCDSVQYDVSYEIEYLEVKSDGSSCFEESVTKTYLPIRLWGAIGGVRVEEYPASLITSGTCSGREKVDNVKVLFSCRGNGSVVGISGEYNYRDAVTSGAKPGSVFVKNISVSRVDGQPDSCGNPGKLYPHSSTPLQPSYDTVLSAGAGGTLIDLPVAINLPGAGGLSASFSPSISLKFNVGAVVFDFGSDSGIPSDLDTKGIKDALSKLLNDDSKAELTEEPIDSEEDSDKEDDEEEGIRALKISLTEIPANANIEVSDNAELIYDAGYVCFKIDGHLLPPERIHHKLNYFPAPMGADGYRVKFNRGFKGDFVVVKEQTKPEV